MFTYVYEVQELLIICVYDYYLYSFHVWINHLKDHASLLTKGRIKLEIDKDE